MDSLADLVVALHADFSDVSPQTAELADDFKALGAQAAETGKVIDTQLDAKLQDLMATGMSLSEALEDLNSTLGAVEEPATAYGEAAQKIIDAQKEADDELKEAQQAVAELQTAFEAGAITAQTFARAVEEAEEAFKKANPEIEKGESNVHELLTEMLAFAGIAASVEALKEFVVEAVHLYAETQKAEIALTAMMGSAEKAEEVIGELKHTAMDLAIPFESLVHAEQKMTAFGLSAEQTKNALHAAADASAATGNSFDSATGAIERMTLGGMAGARQLIALGLKSKDLADVMGVSVESVQKSFKSLEEGTRTEVLIEALDKWKGQSEKAADSVSGSFVKMKNAWSLAMEEVGKTVAPLASMIVAFSIDVANGLRTVALTVEHTFREMIIWAKVATDALSGNFAAVGVGFSNLHKEAEDFYNGLEDIYTKHEDDAPKSQTAADLKKKVAAELAAKEAAKNAYERQKIEIDAEAAHQEHLLTMRRSAYEAAAKLAGTSEAEQVPRLLEFENQKLAITEAAIAKKLALEKKSKEVEADLTLNSQLQKAQDKNAEEQLKLTQRVAVEQEKIWEHYVKTQTEIWAKDWEEATKRTEHVKKLNEELEADQEKTLRLEESSDMQHQVRLLESDRATAAKMLAAHMITAAEKIAIDERIEAEEDAVQKRSIEREIQLLESRDKLQTDFASKREALLSKLQALEDKHTGKDAVSEIERQAEAYKTLGVTSSAALETAATAASAALNQLKAMKAPEEDIVLATEKQLQAEIALQQRRGASTEEFTLDLIALQERQKALQELTVGPLEAAYKDLFTTLHSGISALQSGIDATIMHTKNLGQAWIDVGKKIATSILDTIVGQGLKYVEAELIKVVTAHKAAAATQTAVDSAATAAYVKMMATRTAAHTAMTSAAIAGTTAEVTEEQIARSAQNILDVISASAVAGANAYAAYAWNPPLALTMMTAAIAEVDSLIPLASAEGGFDVGAQGMITQLHPREMVLPQDNADTIRSLNGLPAILSNLVSSSGPALQVSFAGANFYGTPDRAFIHAVGTELVKEIRSAGAYSSKF